jgi:hypothetical protein
MVPGALLPEVKQMAIQLTSILHLIPRLRTRGALKSIPQIISMVLCLIRTRPQSNFTVKNRLHLLKDTTARTA